MHVARAAVFLLLGLAVESRVSQAQRTIHVPADQSTVQAGIDAASDGDTVLVAPGTYAANLKVTGKSITLRSESGAAQTVLDGSQTGPVLSLSGAATISDVVDGFTIRNGTSPGYSPPDGGIVAQTVSVTVQNNIIEGNYGYGIHGTFSRMTILNNQISTVGPGSASSYCYVYADGGIFLFGTGYTATDPEETSRIAGNVITGDGTLCSGPGMTLTVDSRVLVENNIVHGTEAGITVSDVNRPDISLHVVIRQNLVYGNIGSGLSMDYFPFFGNADNGYEPITMIAVNNTFRGNVTGGGAFDREGSPVAEVILLDFFARMALVNNVVVGTSATTPVIDCNILGANTNVVPPVFDHNDIVNLSSPDAPTFLNSCGYVTSLLGINGNISADPKFLSANDLHLATGSPAVDAGNNSAVGLAGVDLDGGSRLQDMLGNGYPVVDMGAYETAGLRDLGTSTLQLTSSIYYQMAPGPFTVTAALASAGVPLAGPVSFLQDDVPLGTVLADATGTASFAPRITQPGIYRFTATYGGSGSLAPAVSQVIYLRLLGTVVSLPASTTTLACSPNPAFPDGSIGLTAQVFVGQTPYSNGTVTFADGANVLGTGEVFIGVSRFQTKLPIGVHALSATFTTFSSSYASSSGTCQEVVVGSSDIDDACLLAAERGVRTSRHFDGRGEQPDQCAERLRTLPGWRHDARDCPARCKRACRVYDSDIDSWRPRANGGVPGQ